MLLVSRFYPKRRTYSTLWTIPTGALWGEVSQGHNDMLTAVGFEPVTPDPNTKALSTAPHASLETFLSQSEAFIYTYLCIKDIKKYILHNRRLLRENVIYPDRRITLEMNQNKRLNESRIEQEE